MPIVTKYKKTVRCGYCRKPGHNRSSCPQYAERIETLRSQHGNDYYVVAQYDARKVRRKASGKARKCSYCSEGGHNRKTCSILKTDMEAVRLKNVEYRKQMFTAMVNHGIFVGAVVESDSNTQLVTPQEYSGGRFQTPMVITSVMWNHINVWETAYNYYSNELGTRAPFKVKPISSLNRPWDSEIGFPLDYDLLWNRMTLDSFQNFNGERDDNGWYSRFKNTYFPTVISRVNAQKPPLGWLTCEDVESEKVLKEYFKKRTSSDCFRTLTKGLTRDEESDKLREEQGYL
tara:strand:+ start:46617 stop:47480 length:864 start_codon:yes stop_codon:yes gene_type:complete